LIRVMSTLVGCSSFLIEAPRGPFYRHKGPRSRWNPIWKAILAFCRVAHRTLSGARFPSKSGADDRCSLGAVGAPDTVRGAPDSPVPPSDRWLGHASRADCAADRWLTGQSGAPSDSPVNYSRTSPDFSRERRLHRN
jgi:hypothetical protein